MQRAIEETASSVLVVEDEFLLAMEIETCLREQGWEVVGPVATVARALERLERTTPALAVLDAELRGETAAPVAAALRARQIPFVLVTGYNSAQLREAELAGAPRLAKPIDFERLLEALAALGTPPAPV